MQAFTRKDLRIFRIVIPNGKRFHIAEFIDEYDTFSMGFFRFYKGMYVLIDIPKDFIPSHGLNMHLWGLLETEDQPPLAVPGGGFYYGHEFHTIKGTAEDISILPGEVIEEIQAPDGMVYPLIFSRQGGHRIAFFGLYAGTKNVDTPHEFDLWRPTPVPLALLNNKDDMLSIYGLLDMVDATLMQFTDRIN